MDIQFLCILNVLAGIYGLVLSYGLIPAKPNGREKLEAWRKKFGGMMKLCSVAAIAAGSILLFTA